MDIRTNQGGFTLFELLLTLSILFIIFGFAVPSLQSLIHKSRIQTTSSSLYVAYTAARTASITRDEQIYLCGSNNDVGCDKRWNKNILIFADRNRNKTADADEIIISQRINLGNGYVKSRIAFGLPYTRFQSDGSVSYTGSFLVCPEGSNPRDYRRLTWNIAGRPYFGIDANGDGIIEDTNSKIIDC